MSISTREATEPQENYQPAGSLKIKISAAVNMQFPSARGLIGPCGAAGCFKIPVLERDRVQKSCYLTSSHA